MRLVVAVAVLATVRCGGPPDVYAPSTPRKPVDVYGAENLASWVAMNSGSAPVSIVRDIGLDVQAGAWRWASRHAELRFFLNTASGWKAKVDYSVARAVLDKSGPLTLTFLANNTPLDTVHHAQDGHFVWEKPVPATILVAGGMNYLRIEADKSAEDAGGHPVSYILTAAGFVR